MAILLCPCFNAIYRHHCSVAHVQAVGRPLSPAFGIQILEPSEKFVLKVLNYDAQPTSPEQTSPPSSLQMRVRDLEQIMNLLQGNVDGIVEYEWDIDDEESDEDEEEDVNIE